MDYFRSVDINDGLSSLIPELFNDVKSVLSWMQGNATFLAVYIMLAKIQEHSLLNSLTGFNIKQKIIFYAIMFIVINVLLGDGSFSVVTMFR